ncbi:MULTISPECIES: HEAT repeat domain-containing protein [unclassified Sphingobacterium]|uniref:HEAT repeat domain-containing protein n=1 Tax=unclassified Sphingobacterium TaxID=2609468 RepID=UPI0025DFBB7B|nr:MULTISPECIES: HEAT repeat domain-containing protein [unclassified Sphingobacterium]
MHHHIALHELILAIVIVLILVLLLIITVLGYSFYSYRILHNKHSWKEIIEFKIMETIVGNDDRSDSDKGFAEHLREPSFRALFLDVLVDSDRKFSGAAKQSINRLFRDFELEDEAWRKLRHRSGYLVAGGVQELAAMNVEAAIPEIMEKLNDPRTAVYQEAQYALVSFKGYEGLGFLDHFNKPLSDWQQLRLLYSIHDIPEQADLQVKDWIHSKNDSVVIFTLRLIRKFRLMTLYTLVFSLLEHPSINVRVQAVRTLQAIESSETIQQFIQGFDLQPLAVQNEMLKAMKMIKSKESEHFLKELLWNHSPVSIKISAAEVLVVLGEEHYLREISQGGDTYDELRQIIKHALQEKKC